MKMDSVFNPKWFNCDTYYNGSMIVPTIKKDSHGNVVALYGTGGGGGASHFVNVQKYNLTGNVVFSHHCFINSATFTADRVFMDIDENNTIYVAGKSFSYLYGAIEFALIKLKEDSTQEFLFFDPDITHDIKGLTVSSENNLFIYGICSDTSSLGSFNCNDNGKNFIAFYGNAATGTNELPDNENIFIFPNPSSGMLTINMNDYKNTTLRIYDVLGNCMSTKECRQSVFQIDLSMQSKGVYFIEIVSDSGRVVKKIVLQ